MRIERVGEPQSQIDTGKLTPPDRANQFEAVFLQSMLKTSCIDQHFTEDTSPVLTPCESEFPHSLNTELAPTETAPATPDIKHTPVSQSKAGFVQSIWPYAKQLSSLIGLDPKILIAQAALETGWGQFIAKNTDGSSSNNLFNIKAKNDDQSVKIKTTEYITDTPVKMMASFKTYPSLEHSFNDYLSLIKGERYKEALANTHDPERYVDALHQAGYATDPNYARKILSIYHGDELQQSLERMANLVGESKSKLIFSNRTIPIYSNVS